MKSNSGFTIIELLVAIAIVGVLSSFALNMFNDMEASKRRNLVQSQLMDMFQAQKSYFYDTGRYATLEMLSDDLDPNKNESLQEGIAMHFEFRLSLAADASSFRYLAVANDEQIKLDDVCWVYHISDLSKNATDSRCWSG